MGNQHTESIVRKMIETETIMTRCQAIAYCIARRDSDIANDISQTAFLAMLEDELDYCEKIECPDDFYSQFRRLARNAHECVMRERRKHIQTECEEQMYTAPADLQAIAQDLLPARLYAIAEWLYQGYTAAEIAVKCGISVPTVKRRKAQIKGLLEKAVVV